MRPSEALARNRDKVFETLARYPFRNPMVFGSAARGDDTDASDLDILVEPESGASYFDLFRLEEELSRVTGVTVDVRSTGEFTQRTLDRIRREGLVAQEGDMNPELADVLRNLLAWIGKVDRMVAGETAARIENDEILQLALAKGLEMIGEVSNRVLRKHPDFAAANPAIPFADAYNLRNRLSHHYERIETGILLEVTRTHLPAMRDQVREALVAAGVEFD